MQVIPEQRAEVVTTLASALKDAGLDTQIIADESSSTGELIPAGCIRRILTQPSSYRQLLRGCANLALTRSGSIARCDRTPPIQFCECLAAGGDGRARAKPLWWEAKLV